MGNVLKYASLVLMGPLFGQGLIELNSISGSDSSVRAGIYY